MLWNILLAIGALLVINGVILTQQGVVVGRVRDCLSRYGDIVTGSHRHPLFLNTTSVMMAVNSLGVITKANALRSGYLRPTRTMELPIAGRNLRELYPEDVVTDYSVVKACRAAASRYERKLRA